MRKSQQPAIIQAVLENDETKLSLLLEADKLKENKEKSVYARDEEGNTALFYAAKKGYLAMMRLLLVAKINVNYSNTCGFTAIHWAARADQRGAVQALIESNANVNVTPCDLFNVGETQRMTPLFVAASRTKNQGGPAVSVVQPLLDAKADPNLKPSDHVAPLHFYLPLFNKNPNIVKLLLLAGAKVQLTLSAGYPLMPERQKQYYSAKRELCLFQQVTLFMQCIPLISNIAKIIAEYHADEVVVEEFNGETSLSCF